MVRLHPSPPNFLPSGIMKIEEKVLSTIKKFSLIAPNDTVLCAVSGGPDSVALLHMLKNFSQTLNIKIYAAHFNHKLRGEESDIDEIFVKNLCQKLSIPLIVGSTDVKRISQGKNVEDTARKERYKFLQATANKLKADKIAVGHTASDLCETIIFNLSKGTGIKGLRGFLPKRDNIVRPLFEITREEVEEYLKSNNIHFRIDSSNFDTKFSRNLIRLHVIPHLKRINPSIERTFLKEAETFRELEDFIENETETALKQGIFTENSFSIDLKSLLSLHPFMAKTILQKAFSKLSGETLSANKLSSIIKLAKRKKSGSLNLKNGFKVLKTQTHLILCRKDDKKSSFEIEIKEIPAKIETPSGTFEFLEGGKGDFEFSKSEINKKLFLRTRKGGEWLSFPYGKKKLKKFFNEKKTPFNIRNAIPLLVTGENEVIWIPGLYKKTYIKESKKKISVRYEGGIENIDT
ncbi:tRNA lysidine(34) synthetase TilS [Desulfurobacterium sp.]